MRVPSRHAPSPSWMRPFTQRLSPTITVLVVANVLTFAFHAVISATADEGTRAAVDNLFRNHLALGPAVFAGRELWQLGTSLFIHLEGLALIFDLIGLWFIGALLERQFGRTRFLVLLFVPAVAANVAIACFSLLVPDGRFHSGLGAGVLGLFVAFGRLYDRTPVPVFGSLVIQARTLALILVGFSLFVGLIQLAQSPTLLVGDVVAIAAAYLLAGGRGGGLRGLWQRLRGATRRRLKVVEGGKRGKGEDRRPGYLN